MWEWLREILSQSLDYLKFFVIVNDYEEALLLSWGKFKLVRTKGTYLKWPIRDFYYHVIVTKDTLSIDEVNLTTADNQTISVGCVIEFSVKDSKKFLIDTNEAPGNMRDIARGVISNTLEDLTWEDVKKKTTLNAIRRKLTTKYEDMGVEVRDVLFTDKCKSFVLKVFTDSGKSESLKTFPTA